MTQDFEQTLSKDNKTVGKKLTSGSSSKTQTQNSGSSTHLRNEKKDKSRETLQTRVVIRHLPPTMTEEQFLTEISPIPEYNDFYFVKADPTLGVYSFCRAYINFLHMEDVFIFKDKFDNYVFVDTKGNEYSAIVEFAAFQKILRRRIGANGQPITAKKRDNKCGSIEQDADYIDFLESLEKCKTESNLPSAEVFLEEIEARDKELRANHGVLKVVTPLIEFIKNRKAEKLRLREERREERRSQQQRIREEEHQRKIKLQLKKLEETKKQKEVEDKDKDRPVKTVDEKHGTNRRDKEKNDMSKRGEARKSDPKKNDRSDRSDRSERRSSFGNRFKNEKPKDNNSGSDSTFVVKVLQNPEKQTENTDTCASSEVNPKISEKPEMAEPKKVSETKSDKKDSNTKVKAESSVRSERSEREREKSDSKSNRDRIRNKDRPTREIYRPGAVKRTNSNTATNSGSQQNAANSSNGQQTTSNSGQKSATNRSEHGYKNRVFTRSKHTD